MSIATQFFTHRPSNASVSFGELTGSAIRWTGLRSMMRVATGFVEFLHRQRMIAQLEALDDRILKDMGVVRSEIWHRVQKGRDV